MRAFVLLIFLLTSLSASAAENNFDKVCGYFEKLDSTLIQAKMTPTQKAKFISALVTKELETDSAARQTWEVLAYAVPVERYEMYQATAAELLKSNWQCDFMKKQIASTGK